MISSTLSRDSIYSVKNYVYTKDVPCTKWVNILPNCLEGSLSRFRMMESAVLRIALFIYLDTANICDKFMNDNKNMVTIKTVSFLPKSPITKWENDVTKTTKSNIS